VQKQESIENDRLHKHLVGACLPNITLPATNGMTVTLSKLLGAAIIFCYPMTSKPGVQPPTGWDKIPGARGCTLQNCSYKNNFSILSKLNVQIYGMSTQHIDYQREMAERLHLPFSILSDSNFEFCDTMKIPTFTVDDKRLMKRLTMVVENGFIEAVHFPISQSTSDPDWAISYLTSRI